MIFKLTLAIASSFFLAACISTSSTPNRFNEISTPSIGVLCDQYICADEYGISIDLTKKYLGEAQAKILSDKEGVDITKITFSNDIHCDTTERSCYRDRHHNRYGLRSAVSTKYTIELFGAESITDALN